MNACVIVFFQAEDGIRDLTVTGVQTCALPISVLDARFVRRRDLALGLERRFPDRFIPRYSMVMFRPEIAYAEALRRGAVQAQLLEELARGTGGEPDGALAEKLITERLSPISSARARS